MGVSVRHWCMDVHMRMRLASRIVRSMVMLMVLVMNMPRLMLSSRMIVKVLVAFGEVQIDANGHQPHGPAARSPGEGLTALTEVANRDFQNAGKRQSLLC
jgi:hypothetical protein